VVTGQGVVTPLGTGVDKFWAALKKGECGIRQVQSFDTHDLYITIAGEIPDFDPKERLQSKSLLLADKYSQYAGCAAQEAVAMSKLEVPLQGNDAYRAACIIGSGVGGLTTLEFSYKMLFKENKRATHPLTLLKAIGSSASAHVSIEYSIKGPTFGVVSACSTATHAIGLVYRMIREGLVDVGLAFGLLRRHVGGGAEDGARLASHARLEPRRIVALRQEAQRHRSRRRRRHPDAGGV
jgi:nodulation protein E